MMRAHDSDRAGGATPPVKGPRRSLLGKVNRECSLARGPSRHQQSDLQDSWPGWGPDQRPGEHSRRWTLLDVAGNVVLQIGDDSQTHDSGNATIDLPVTLPPGG